MSPQLPLPAPAYTHLMASAITTVVALVSPVALFSVTLPLVPAANGRPLPIRTQAPPPAVWLTVLDVLPPL